MDLLVSYPWGQFARAKAEALRILQSFGDPAPLLEKTKVWGIAIAHTALDNRAVIRRCRALWQAQPHDSFRFALKWVPVDYWCPTELAAMKQVIDVGLAVRIGADQSWGMKVHKRRWQRYHSDEIVAQLAVGIARRVDLRQPDWILWVDVIGEHTALALLKPDDIFSITV